jgi:predicted DsbA family dithiol-disulfide isomerase
VEWKGVEIHPEIPPEGLNWPPHLRARFGGMSDMLRTEAQQAGLAMVVPEVIPNSRWALEASEYAREQGKHESFHRVVFRKFYGEGQDLSSWTMLQDASAEVGLDGHTMQHKTENGDFTAIVNAHKAELITLGGTGVPLYIFDNKYAIVGLRPYAAFQEVMEHIKSENADAGRE